MPNLWLWEGIAAGSVAAQSLIEICNQLSACYSLNIGFNYFFEKAGF